MTTHLCAVVIDTPDPARLADWWADVLDWRVEHFDDEESEVVPPEGAPGIDLTFAKVDDERVAKNRIHLDLASTDEAAQAVLVERLLAAGARRVDLGQADKPWVALTDPDGNEFCVLEPRPENAQTGPVAAIVVDAEDPASLARFWVSASGWRLCEQTGFSVALCRPDGTGPRLEFNRSTDERRAKNRVHLDVAPQVGDDQAVEVARLHALDARPVDVGQDVDKVTWVVLLDPENNEFCVLSPR